MKKPPLFVYSQLKNPHKPDNVLVRGELRRRNDPTGDGAAKFSPNAKGFVYGQIFDGPDDVRLKRAERPEYNEQEVTTADGRKVHAFHYIGPIESWRKFEKIPSGKWIAPTKGKK